MPNLDSELLTFWEKISTSSSLAGLSPTSLGPHRRVWEISNTALVMVFARMRTLTIGAACEFTRAVNILQSTG